MSTSSTADREFERKLAEGRTFRRLECERCGATFHFTESPRVTRVPRCPHCGMIGGHPLAA